VADELIEIRKLPVVVGDRVESGPVQFGDDLPGTFIRGGQSAYYAACLGSLLASGDFVQVGCLEKAAVQNLIEQFRQCMFMWRKNHARPAAKSSTMNPADV
jgi:hypothetical protein